MKATAISPFMAKRFGCLGVPLVALVRCLFCISMLAVIARALDPELRVTQYIHQSWRVQDGSSPAGMFSLAQTSDGFLWSLSLSGDLYRFDGVRSVPWPVPGGPLGKVLSDNRGGLWVFGDELYHLVNGAVTSHFQLKDLHGFQSAYEDADGKLWVGLRGAKDPLCSVANESLLRCFGKDDGIPLEQINAVLPDGNGGLWLGGPTGLVRWRQSGLVERYPVKSAVLGLARTPDGVLWLGMEEGPESGLRQLRDGALKSLTTPTFDGTKISVTSLTVDRDGNLWVASDAKGLFRIHGNAVERYAHSDGLSGDSVWALFADREGMVWAGTTSGIDSFRDPRVITFSSLQGLGKDLAAGILATRDGTIWVANDGSLDRIQNGAVTSIVRSNGLPGEQVSAMLEDHAGNLWVGVDDALYLLKDGAFRRIPTPDGHPLGMIVAMTEDIDGNIWAECASRPSRLVRIRDFQVREVFTRSQVPAGHHLASDSRGGIWIAAKSEAVLFRNGHLETRFSLPPDGSPLNRDIVSFADGSVLVGTESGLVGWRNGKLQRMTVKNGLPCDFVISLIQDNAKRWWLYTRCGVVEFAESDMQRWWADPDTKVPNRLYDALDGAMPNIGSFKQSALSPDGRVWFASGVVVQSINPSKLSEELPPSPVSIESIVADRKRFKPSADVRIPPNPRDLEFDYTSPTLAIPQKVKFRYRLRGYDRDWREAGMRREAYYTNLPPGRYAFLVMAGNSAGEWNAKPAELAFIVTPAYYQTNWFRVLSGCILIFLLWAVYQVRMRQLHHQFEITLDARVAERTRIARDLHDTLLQSFHGLLLRFQTASQMLPERPREAKEKLDAAVQQAADAITEGRDAVQGLRESTLQGNDLALAIRTLGGELAGQVSTPPALRVTVEGTSRMLHPIVRDEIYKVAAEALRNVFRHSDAHQVEVEIRYADVQFRLRVRDDGKGIDPQVLSARMTEGHYGLTGMRERAKLIGGNLTVWSELESGSEIELVVPAANAYATRINSWYTRAFSAKK